MKVIPGTVQSCANVLKDGNLLAISPGGVYESQFSHQYNLMWKKRLGFAKVALEAKVVSISAVGFMKQFVRLIQTYSLLLHSLNCIQKFSLSLYTVTVFIVHSV